MLALFVGALLANALSDAAPSETLLGGNPTYRVPLYGRRDTERLNPTLRSNLTVAEGLCV